MLTNPDDSSTSLALTPTERAVNDALKALTVAKIRTELARRRIVAGRLDVDVEVELHDVLAQLDRLQIALIAVADADRAS